MDTGQVVFRESTAEDPDGVLRKTSINVNEGKSPKWSHREGKTKRFQSPTTQTEHSSMERRLGDPRFDPHTRGKPNTK